MRANERREVERGVSAAAGVVIPMLVAACGGGPKPAPAPSPEPTTSAPRTPAPTPAPTPGAAGRGSEAALGRFAYAPGTYRYEVRTESTVELAGSQERETVATSARVIYTTTRGTRAGSFTMTGAVDSIAVQASARVVGAAGAADMHGVVIPFRGTVDATARGASAAGGTRVELVDGTPRCALPEGSAQAAALAAARETVLRVPAAIPVGTRWRDSVVTAGCSGDIPTTVTTVVRYEVVGAARFGGVDGVRVRREATSTWRGAGIARGRQVFLAGSGTGEGSVYLDAVGGRVLGGEGEGRATVRVTVGREAPQEFAQRTRVRVRLLTSN